MEALCDKLLQLMKDGGLQYTLDEGRIRYANQGLMNIFNIDGNPEALQGKLIKTLIFDVKTEKKIKTLFLHIPVKVASDSGPKLPLTLSFKSLR